MIRNKPHNNQLCTDLFRFISAYPVVSHFLRFAWQTTIAVGYAVNDATDRDYADVFNRADRQMYLDKQEIKKTARATDYVDNR